MRLCFFSIRESLNLISRGRHTRRAIANEEEKLKFRYPVINAETKNKIIF